MGSIHLINTPLTESLSLEKILELTPNYEDPILYQFEKIECEILAIDSILTDEDEGKRELEKCIERLQESLNWYRSFKS